MRIQVNGTELTGLSNLLTDDARALGEIGIPSLQPDEIGDHRLAEALDDFESRAGTGVTNLAQAANALADWMLLAAEVAEADDGALAAEFRAQHVSLGPTRNLGAQAAMLGRP